MKLIHFWYSEKQKEVCGDMGTEHVCYVKIDGRYREYTECRLGKKRPTGKWDDFKYLGSVPEKELFNYIKIKKRRYYESRAKNKV